MSYITLTETQSAATVSYSDKGVCVAMPLLYKDTTELTSTLTTKTYKKSTDLMADFASRFLTIDTADDRSYLMAKDLLDRGYTVIIEPIKNPVSGGTLATTHDEAIAALVAAVAPSGSPAPEGCLDKFKSKNTYSINFITVGAYESTYISGNTYNAAMSNKLISISSNRQDCIALIDLPESTNTDVVVTAVGSLAENSVNRKWSASVYPWCKLTSGNASVYAPSSWYWLVAYAESMRKGNSPWILPAGIYSGIIPSLVTPKYEVGEALQQVLEGSGESTVTNCVNVVMNCGEFGYRIMGDSVLYKETVTDGWQGFLSVRLINTIISRVAYLAAYNVMYNPNDDVAWAKFKTYSASTLDKMKTGRGILTYRWVKNPDAARGKLNATLKYQPIETVKTIEINLSMTDSTIGMEEI